MGLFSGYDLNGPGQSESSLYVLKLIGLYTLAPVSRLGKTSCYRIQTCYALRMQGGDFAEALGLYSTAEENFRGRAIRV